MLTMKIGALAGSFIALPVHHLSGLDLHRAGAVFARKEDGDSRSSSSATLFFVLGAAFSHYVGVSVDVEILRELRQTEYMEFLPSIDEVFGLYVKMLLGFGLIFQMPTIVYFLARMGVVTARFLLRNTKYAVLIIFIVAAVISPGTDVVSQCLMAVPMLGALRDEHLRRVGLWPNRAVREVAASRLARLSRPDRSLWYR